MFNFEPDKPQMWAAACGLIYWKILACVLIALARRHRHCALARGALTLTAAVYGYLALIGFLEILALGI